MQLELLRVCDKTARKPSRKFHFTYWSQSHWCEECFTRESIEVLKGVSSFFRRANRQRGYQKYANKKPIAKIRENLRGRLRRLLKNSLINSHRNIKKSSLVGCDRIQLKTHIEKQFTTGMTWGNYGKWHIDHIKPLAAFNLAEIKQLKEATHYSNLQPLWAKDNFYKGDKYDGII